MPGATRLARLWIDAFAPCNCPCSDGDTRLLIRPPAAGEANPHSAITGTPRQNSQPVEREAERAGEEADHQRPPLAEQLDAAGDQSGLDDHRAGSDQREREAD